MLLLQAEAQPVPTFPCPLPGARDAVKARAAGTSWPFCPFPWSMHIFSSTPSQSVHICFVHICSCTSALCTTTAQCTSAPCTFPASCPPPREAGQWQGARGRGGNGRKLQITLHTGHCCSPQQHPATTQTPISPAVAAELPPRVAPAVPLAGGTEAKTGFPGRGNCCQHRCL